MEEKELKDLAKRVKASDHDAFEKLFHLFQQAIFHFLFFRTKDKDLAEDLLQEVFLKLWKSRSSINENHSIKNYLYTISDNLLLNHIRHLKVVQRHQEQSESKLFSSSDSPQFILEEKEWNIKLMESIEALPEKTRIIFLMSRTENLTYQEIAERLSISIKTVEGHMVKALKTLHQSLRVKL